MPRRNRDRHVPQHAKPRLTPPREWPRPVYLDQAAEQMRVIEAAVARLARA